MPGITHITNSTSTSHIYMTAGVNLYPVGASLTLGWLHPDTLSVAELETVLDVLTLVIGSGNYPVSNSSATPMFMPQVEIHLHGAESSFTINIPPSFSPEDINSECILEAVERMLQAYLKLRMSWRDGCFELSDLRLDWSGMKVLMYSNYSRDPRGHIDFALWPQLSAFGDESSIDDTL